MDVTADVASIEEVDESAPNEWHRPVKRRTLVGPWKNVAEFNKVYDWLFGDAANDDTLRRALSQMRVWSLRRSSLCPAAVLATSVILRARLQDDEGAENLQVLYASAFTRFFNFMSSIMQTHNMRTMYETANQLGLLSFVVDLRHICAHGQELPPLPLLRSTAKYCLEWLQQFYWLQQRETICDVDATCIRRKDKTKFDDDVSSLFAIYDTALECYLQGARNLKSCKRLVHGKRFANMKEFYNIKGLTDLRTIFDVVVKELGSLVKREVAIKDQVEIYIEAMLKMRSFFTMPHKQKPGKKLEALIDATQSLFRMLAGHGFIEDVFQSFLQFMENPNVDDVRKRGASFWAHKIVGCFIALRMMKQMYKEELDKNPKFKLLDFSSLNTDGLNKTMRLLLVHAHVDPKTALLFSDTTRRPRAWVFELDFIEKHLSVINKFTGPVLKSLLPLIEPALPEERINALKDLITIYMKSYAKLENVDGNDAEVAKSADDNEHDSDDVVYTAKDVLLLQQNATQAQALSETAVSVEECAEFGIWSVVSDDGTHNWTTCPLGRLPWY